ncbi:ZIP family zinc transporter [Saccharopolyspora lacisalsi]|uniref:ZIP family zinc transporter n=1 Tax=Halosaccharopolyspora lacisalsi TaxID=1000566 RepID=A0A839E0F6_9PSEU|nr:ZIP family metal transporter [Halosaccharopolyspora lacisalsi]MBA8824458.1 ZIP family zinc transporter [Halosaccharopolyspora lacisalsi]
MTLTTREHHRAGEHAWALGTAGLLLGMCAAAGAAQLWKLLIIAVASCLSMIAGAVLGRRAIANSHVLTWANGATAGAMVTSACAFLLPMAITQDPKLGGFGTATGVLVGFALHNADRLSTRTTPDDCVVRLTIHAVTAGLVIGAVYASMPNAGVLLGLSIVSHKGPAGYAAARSLRRAGEPVTPVVLPACGVGISSIAVGLLGWSPPTSVTAVVFGVAAGLFLHVALDFLAHLERTPEPSGGRLSTHATASTLTGGAVVVFAWMLTGA